MEKLKGVKEVAKLLKQRGERIMPISQECVKEHNKYDYSKEERINTKPATRAGFERVPQAGLEPALALLQTGF
jgi:hypothetical protein